MKGSGGFEREASCGYGELGPLDQTGTGEQVEMVRERNQW